MKRKKVNILKTKLLEIKDKFDWKKKYKSILKLYEEEKERNARLQVEIDSLEFKLEKDFQAKKIEELESSLQHKWDIIHRLREEIIKLKKN